MAKYDIFVTSSRQGNHIRISFRVPTASVEAEDLYPTGMSRYMRDVPFDIVPAYSRGNHQHRPDILVDDLL